MPALREYQHVRARVLFEVWRAVGFIAREYQGSCKEH
jgi:hypothetical protein